MPDQEDQQHIPVNSKEQQEDDSKDSGSGGLLSMVGDPAGMSFPPLLPQPSLLTRPTFLTIHPTGKVLGTALRPIGAPLEKGVTGPLGNAVGGTTRGALGPLMGHEEEKSEVLGGKNKDSYEKKESIGGKEQTGDNPLGLDQTGRWGFEGDQ